MVKKVGKNYFINRKDYIRELLEEGRLKNTFLNRFSHYLYLRPLLEEHNTPLGKEVKMNL